MITILKHEPPDYVITLRAENENDAQLMMWYLQPDNKAFLKAVNRPYQEFPDLEIRKEPE